MSDSFYELDEKKVSNYFSSRATKYQVKSQSGIWSLFRKIESASVFNSLDLKDLESVLEVGCGTGFYSAKILKFNVNLTAIDTNLEMILAANNAGIPALNRDIYQMKDQKFDKILIAGVLEFCKDPAAIVSCCKQMLNPSGKIVVLHPPAGLFGYLYSLVHRLNGCPTHFGKLFSNIISEPGWTSLKSTLISKCSTWTKE